jgi:GTP cyclohydrolase II
MALGLSQAPSAPAVVINGEPAAVRVNRAIGELRQGRTVLVEGVEGAVLTAAASTVAAAQLAAMRALGRGPVLLGVTAARAAALGLAGAGPDGLALEVPATADPDWLRHTAFEPVGEAPGAPAWPIRPVGAAAVSLARQARLPPAVAFVPVARSAVAAALAAGEVLAVAADDIARFPVALASVARLSETRMPLADAPETRLILFRDGGADGLQVALVIGRPDPRAAVPVRIHSACLTGDLFGSLRCDCGEQLRMAVREIVTMGGGVLLYLAQEGRGIGLANKMLAYNLQDSGLDTVDADQVLGFGEDERRYEVAAAMLRDLGLQRVSLLTNSPGKLAALQRTGIAVEQRVALIGTVTEDNRRYLTAKARRAGHLLGDDLTGPGSAA